MVETATTADVRFLAKSKNVESFSNQSKSCEHIQSLTQVCFPEIFHHSQILTTVLQTNVHAGATVEDPINALMICTNIKKRITKKEEEEAEVSRRLARLVFENFDSLSGDNCRRNIKEK